MNFGACVLTLDAAAETERITSMLRAVIGKTMRRRGAVVGISGGVDLSVVLALCVRAFGAETGRSVDPAGKGLGLGKRSPRPPADQALRRDADG